MQLNLAFPDQSNLPASPSPASPSPSWDQLDEVSRIAALEILVRLISRMLAPEAVKGASDE
jgi:hypothetical protein